MMTTMVSKCRYVYKIAQLRVFCLLNQFGTKKQFTVSDNKSKRCIVRSGKDRGSGFKRDTKKFQYIQIY